MKKILTAASAAILSMSMVFNAFAATKLATPSIRWKDGEEAVVEWTRIEDAGGRYYMETYRNGEEFSSGRHTFHGSYVQEYLKSSTLRNELEEPGTYKVRVKALGDGIETEDSDWSDFTEGWKFAMPSLRFGVPGNLRWDGTESAWDAPDNAEEYEEYLNGYEVTLYADGKELIRHNSVGRTDCRFDQAEYMTEEADEYTFSVRAISNTPSVIFNGGMSAVSGAYGASSDSAATSDKIDEILNSENEEDIKNAPDTLAKDRDQVQIAMQTDPAAVDKVSQLEEAYTEQNHIRVEKEISEEVEISGEDIQIVGAGLNAEEPGSAVTFHVTKPEKESVVDYTMYRSAVQVDLSLSGAVKDLKVPVQITLPIPENINPKFFTVLHCHSDGRIEEIIPPQLIIDEDARTAKFTVTSFSTFVLAEKGMDIANVATPSDATEFEKLVDALPNAESDLTEEEQRDVMKALAKVRDALRGNVKASDMTEEMVEKLDVLVRQYGNAEIDFNDNIEDMTGGFLLAYAEGDGEAQTFVLNAVNVATSSNASKKLTFELEGKLIEDEESRELTNLKSPLIVKVLVPEEYAESHKSSDKISGAGIKTGTVDYENGVITFMTTKLGKVTVSGKASGSGSGSGSSSGGGSRGRSGIVRESELPKSLEGGSWKLADGKYSYYYQDGSRAESCWLEINSNWYYFGADGIMATGWLSDGGNYFYLNPSEEGVYGAMATGWKQIDGKWYYFNPSGDGFKGMMLRDAYVDGYYVGSDGAWNP